MVQLELPLDGPRLLATSTGEPLQPVRLAYSSPSRSYVGQRLAALRCLERDGRGYRWLFRAEATRVSLGEPVAGLQNGPENIPLGELRFPKSGLMTLQTRSIQRAIEGALFFAPVLGPRVVLRRVRVVNRFYSADELKLGLEALDRHLDQNVTIVDPEVAAKRMEEDYAGCSSMEDFEAAASRFLQRRIASREDVPLVEDFPLAPEEETGDFRDLKNTLGLRLARCFRRWKGEDLTLTEVILDAMKQAPAEQDGGRRAVPDRCVARPEPPPV